MKPFDFQTYIAPFLPHLPKESHLSRLKFLEEVIPQLVALNQPLYCVETGAMHTESSQQAGSYTLMLATLIRDWTGGKLWTVDCDAGALEKCRRLTREFAGVIEYVCADSVSFLAAQPLAWVRRLNLVLLDSWDLDVFDPMPSQIHHLRELLAVVENLRDCVVAVDDNFLPGCWVDVFYGDGTVRRFETGESHVGKGTLVRRFLLDRGWTQGFEGVVGHNNLFWFQPPTT